MTWRTSKAAWIDECPTASWTQGLPSTSFRLMKAPCRFFPTGDARLTTRRVRESAHSSYFRRKCRRLSAPQRVYGQQQPLRYLMQLCNWMSNARLETHGRAELILHDR